MKATWENVYRLFDRVRIQCVDDAGKYWVSGWKCRSCGWKVGSIGVPQDHDCLGDAVYDEERKE